MIPFNYKYLLNLATKNGGRILDYGCGRGEIVCLGRQKALNIWGADTYSGHYFDSFKSVPAECRDYIRPIRSAHADFPDASFDLVVTNQVLEHVTDPEATIADMRRLLKPGGTLIAAFPVKSTWYEGHVGLYFAHWISSGLTRRAAFMVANWFGLGLYRNKLSARAWAISAEQTLDNVCFYYPLERMLTSLNTIGLPVDIASDYMRARFGTKVGLIPDVILKFIYHKRAGEIFMIVRKL